MNLPIKPGCLAEVIYAPKGPHLVGQIVLVIRLVSPDEMSTVPLKWHHQTWWNVEADDGPWLMSEPDMKRLPPPDELFDLLQITKELVV